MLNFNSDQTVKLLSQRTSGRPLPRQGYSSAIETSLTSLPGTGPTSAPAASLGPESRPAPSGSNPLPAPSSTGPSSITIFTPSGPSPAAPPAVIKVLLDDAPLRRNLRAIERHFDDSYYTRHFPAQDLIPLASTGASISLIPTATPRFPAVILTKNLGANPTCALTFRRPSEWLRGRIRARYWYTSPVGSTNNFLIQVGITAVKTGEVLPGTSLLGGNVAVPGPAVANTRTVSGTLYSTVSFDSDDEVFSVRVVRMSPNASDTNANEFHLLGIELVHVPNTNEG